MTCPLTKAESVDDKLNKTGERLLTELGDLANVSGKSRNAIWEDTEELFLCMRSSEVFAGMCWQTINGHL